MTEITPRWEWRSFGRRFGPAEAQLAKLQAKGTQDSDEIYLLAPAGANVKIRDALMDIKLLREVNADGLEQWTPVMKAGFPLPAAEAAKVLEALGLPAPTALRASYALDEFLAQFAAPGSAVRAVTVHKRRTRCTVGGCMGELSEVVANGKATRTLAVESEDAAAVMRAVRELGLGGYTNTSYLRGLAALVDDAPERYAVIDAGTNSIKFLIAERGADGRWRSAVDRAEVTRLGEGLVPQGAIVDAALQRTIQAIAGMAAEARQHGVRAIAAVGTAGLRMASNGAEVVAAIRAQTGIAIEVISGEEEGRLAFVAAKSSLGLKNGSLAVFDTGGGSSQFSFGHDAVVDERFSVDVGAVRYTERYRLDHSVTPQVLQQALAAIATDLSRLDGRALPDALVGMGGAVTNMTAVMHQLVVYDPTVVQGSVIERAEIDRQIELYRSGDAEARRAIVGLQPSRAEVILAGACIVRTIMDKLGQQRFAVSDRGLRHGVLAERFADCIFPPIHHHPRRSTMATRTASEAAKTTVRASPATAARKTASRKAVKPAPPALAKPLSGEDIMKIVRLGRRSNSVELKLSVPLSGHRATIKGIGLDPVEAQPRQAYFFDTPDLALNRAGVVVRVRRIQGGTADTVIKLRPVDPATLDPDIRRSAAFKVEVNVMPGGFVCSASFKGLCSGQEVLDVSDGTLALRKIFSKEQRAFYDAHAPAGITMDKLTILGPTFLLKARHQPKNFDRRITVELWLYPDGTSILEVSTKCLPDEALKVAADFKAFLAGRGIALGAEQAPKTKTSLDFFSAKLRSEGLSG